jgi:O-Antigen ligase
MITLLFGLGIAILLTCIVSIFFWSKIQFNWLQRLCTLLTLSLPFEYFPRIELGGASWRISQVLVMIGFWIIAILVSKKDNKLLSHKLHFVTWYPLVFLILSVPSWFAVQDLQRFIIHLVGTIFVFGALILLANFATNIWKNLQRLALVLFGCSIFGLYQFFGDLIGIPPSLTLLRDHYTKIVFGMPRVQGTAVEPLYFAGMLLIAIFVLIFWICERVECDRSNKKPVILSVAKDPVPEVNIQQNLHSELVSESKSIEFFETNTSAFTLEATPVSFVTSPLSRCNLAQFILNAPQRILRSTQDDGHIFSLKYLFLILSTIFTAFLLTISKGTFGVLAILSLVLVPVLYLAFDFVREFVGKYIIQTILIAVLGLSLLIVFVNPLILLGEIGTNFVETIAGTSASAVERSMFVNEAINEIRQNPFFGIGMGQFGEYAGNNLGGLNEDGKAIVNNVYLEIWLEEGLLAVFFFVLMLVQPVVMLLKNVAMWASPLRTNKLAALSLIFILIGYYIQWTLFSPVFIMPIFICLGLAYNLINCQDSNMSS